MLSTKGSTPPWRLRDTLILYQAFISFIERKPSRKFNPRQLFTVALTMLGSGVWKHLLMISCHSKSNLETTIIAIWITARKEQQTLKSQMRSNLKWDQIWISVACQRNVCIVGLIHTRTLWEDFNIVQSLFFRDIILKLLAVQNDTNGQTKSEEKWQSWRSAGALLWEKHFLREVSTFLAAHPTRSATPQAGQHSHTAARHLLIFFLSPKYPSPWVSGGWEGRGGCWSESWGHCSCFGVREHEVCACCSWDPTLRLLQAARADAELPETSLALVTQSSRIQGQQNDMTGHVIQWEDQTQTSDI